MMTPAISPEQNKAVVRRLIEEIDRGNLAVVDECFAPDYLDHNPTPIRELATGIEGIRRAYRVFREAFPDTQHAIEDLIAEGDRVVARFWAEGTHTGNLMGVPPTGKRVTMTGIAIYRLVGGKIVERWVEQGTGILEQLGISQLEV